MSNSTKKKSADSEEALGKKKTLKYALIFISVVGVIFLAIWFGRELLAPEEIISITNMTVNGRPCSIQLSEKTGRENFGDQKHQVEPGAPHYAYFLELKDAGNQTSLSKRRFKSPVMLIQEKPVMIVLGGVVWLVSTTRSEHRDEQGFILKFSVRDNAIEPRDFIMDDKYGIREINGSRVYLSDGSGIFTTNHAMYGGLYLDLETEKIVDDRRN